MQWEPGLESKADGQTHRGQEGALAWGSCNDWRFQCHRERCLVTALGMTMTTSRPEIDAPLLTSMRGSFITHRLPFTSRHESHATGAVSSHGEKRIDVEAQKRLTRFLTLQTSCHNLLFFKLKNTQNHFLRSFLTVKNIL